MHLGSFNSDDVLGDAGSGAAVAAAMAAATMAAGHGGASGGGGLSPTDVVVAW